MICQVLWCFHGFGLHYCQMDHSVSIYTLILDAYLLVVYVDDSNYWGWLECSFITTFSHQRSWLWYFLGIVVARSKQYNNLSQRKYIFDILEETWLLGSCLVETSMVPSWKLLKDEWNLFQTLADTFNWLGGLIFSLSQGHTFHLQLVSVWE